MWFFSPILGIAISSRTKTTNGSNILPAPLAIPPFFLYDFANEENKKNLLKLETKLDSLEKDISRKNQFITSDSSISDKLSFLNDITFYLKSNIDYNINDEGRGRRRIYVLFRKKLVRIYKLS